MACPFMRVREVGLVCWMRVEERSEGGGVVGGGGGCSVYISLNFGFFLNHSN